MGWGGTKPGFEQEVTRSEEIEVGSTWRPFTGKAGQRSRLAPHQGREWGFWCFCGVQGDGWTYLARNGWHEQDQLWRRCIPCDLIPESLGVRDAPSSGLMRTRPLGALFCTGILLILMLHVRHMWSLSFVLLSREAGEGLETAGAHVRTLDEAELVAVFVTVV